MAVHTLGHWGESVKAALKEALESEQDEKVRAAITAALQ